MKVVILGGGSVGRTVAHDLLENDSNSVWIVDRSSKGAALSGLSKFGSRFQLIVGDACSLEVLSEANVGECDIVVAATGDDQVNLVASMLAKTEFGAPKVVARVNHPSNEWLFDESWGVDMLVSTPSVMTAIVKESISYGQAVEVFKFNRTGARLVEITLDEKTDATDRQIARFKLPAGCVLLSIVRDGVPLVTELGNKFEAGDEIILLVEKNVPDKFINQAFNKKKVGEADL